VPREIKIHICPYDTSEISRCPDSNIKKSARWMSSDCCSYRQFIGVEVDFNICKHPEPTELLGYALTDKEVNKFINSNKEKV